MRMHTRLDSGVSLRHLNIVRQRQPLSRVKLTMTCLLLFCREFLQKVLPSFKEQNPQLEVTEALRRGRHPYLRAEYGEQDLLR